jgi:arginine N-succinyltransferase
METAMFIVRPVRKEDLGGLRMLAASAKQSITTLPDDKSVLENRIVDSLRAFDERVRKPGGESYLLVLEDTVRGQIIGTCGIVSKVGGFDPFYTFRITTEMHACEEPDIRTEIPLLQFTANHDGPAEIGSLFLNPRYRKRGLARLLSLSRFMFMAAHPDHFDRMVISELRGIVDAAGRSPFWENVGRRFFDSDFMTVDRMSGTGRKDFIAKLRPGHPIYIPLLPKPARDAIGRVHPDSAPALTLLREEGLAYNNEVDIFDAGPTVSARLAEVRIVREIRKALVGSATARDAAGDFIICNGSLAFRACRGPLGENPDGTIALPPGISEGLMLSPGDAVWFGPARRRKDKS